MNYDDELIHTGGAQNEQSVNTAFVYKKNGGFVKGLLVGIFATLMLVIVVTVPIGLIYFALTNNKVVDAKTDTKLDRITNLIENNYFGDVNDEDLQEGIYKGVVEGLDEDYSEYYTAEEYEDLQISTTGNYKGIGAQLIKDEDTGKVTIVRVYDGTPAEEAGLKVNDELISADGVLAVDENLNDFVRKIRGEENTSVEIVYSRGGEEHTVSITRQNIIIPSVYYEMLDDGIGLIEISEFSDNTLNEFNDAIADLESQGLKSIIFDLRNNPGGMVDSVTDILDVVLPEGTTVYMMNKDDKKTTYTSDAENYLDYPMVVLTSENTASAAEIFSGAIRDYEYGTLIGTKTYGKGIVQSIFPLADGSAVKLTVAKYYTPSGECIHEKGITPDIELEYEYTGDENAEEYDYSADNQVQKAIEVLKSGG